MFDLQELYQEVIIDHNRNPRNFHSMSESTNHADGFNPLCGDKLSLFLKLDNKKIIDASFTGSGCAISTASASLMTESLKGKSVSEANELFTKFHDLVMDKSETPEKLDKLAVLAGVKAFPSRVKCATLAWHTLQAALKNNEQPVTTE